MPEYCYSCECGNKATKFKKNVMHRNRRWRCKVCGLFMRRDYVAERNIPENKIVHLDRNEEPISHLLRKRSTKGHWVENLTPNPVYVTNPKQYNSLLKATHSREKAA